MDAEELSAVAGVLLSLSCSYLPGVKERFGGLTPVHKRLVMLALLVVAAAGAFGLSCLDAPGLDLLVSCDREGAWGLLRSLAAAVIANQAVFSISPREKPDPKEACPEFTRQSPKYGRPEK
jgi:hypothetical protein